MNLDDEEIEQKISAGEITALTLDTSSFGNPSEMSLEYGTPSKLSQFKDSEVILLLTDIVSRELIEHMKKTASDAQSDLKKALKQVANGWLVTKETRSGVLDTLFNGVAPEVFAVNRYQKFVDQTGAQKIDAHEHVDIKELMARYFDNKPPFSATKENKKFEFPDAFALMSLEQWAIKNGTQILVVSKDKDWIEFCDPSEHLIVVKELAEALSFFHAESSVATNVLANKIRNGELPELVQTLNDSIQDYIGDVDFIINADSAYNYDYDFYDNEVVWTSLQESNSIKLFPIASSEEDIEIELTVSVLIEVSVDFTFTATDWVDKDEVPLGSASHVQKELIDLSVLFTIGKTDIETGDIFNIEIDGPKRVNVEFGEVEPDWMSEPPEEEYDFT